LTKPLSLSLFTFWFSTRLSEPRIALTTLAHSHSHFATRVAAQWYSNGCNYGVLFTLERRSISVGLVQNCRHFELLNFKLTLPVLSLVCGYLLLLVQPPPQLSSGVSFLACLPALVLNANGIIITG